MKPRYTHDCSQCMYLETSDHWDHNFGGSIDWYWCSGILDGSIIGRFSSAGPDYWSMAIGIIRRSEPPRSPMMLMAMGVIASHRIGQPS